MSRPWLTLDGNEATARVAYLLSEVIAIYPITPSSNMGEWADQWASEHRPNLWGAIPTVVEMQSEGGAAGACHGAMQAGALATTFTASQGLLLMIPNMFKIAGELTPAVFHVSARAVASHALSIFGDHSDVMAVRSTGWALMASGSVQEAQDLAAISHAATLETRVPTLHFFDGFRTSHEVAKIQSLGPEELRELISEEQIEAHRARALSPERPVLRGSAQNPDVFFQAREAATPFYLACPALVQRVMDRFATITGRKYRIFDYYGAPDADRVIVVMGSAEGAVEETVDALNAAGEKVGLLKVRLFRPFSSLHFVRALPKTVRGIAVLDRTKEAGAAGEPLYQDVLTALAEHTATTHLDERPTVIGGRYGLGSKEFTPAMAKAAFDELKRPAPRSHFTCGIVDDVSFSNLEWDEEFSTERDDTVRAVLYGLGSDGTVGANKNTIKIIGESTDQYAQGYFVYDSKKSGSTTISHLRFGPHPIRSTYLVRRAGFIACHQWELLERMDVLEAATPGATLLLNSPYGPDEVWAELPGKVQRVILENRMRVFTIDATSVANATGMGKRVNTILQTCFFALSGILPKDEAIASIKNAVKKTYGAKGEQVVKQNFDAIDQSLAHLHEVKVPEGIDALADHPTPLPWREAPDFVQTVLAPIIVGKGDLLPVSAMPIDGTFPVGTAKWEKRNLAETIPVWTEPICIQCGKCALVCPHAAIRIKAYDPVLLASAPPTFKSMDYKGAEYAGQKYTIQVAPEDCTGCELCVEVCPAADKKTGTRALEMKPQRERREPERANWEFFLSIPEVDRRTAKRNTVKGSQFLEPLFEFSGACSGCGETPYIKLATQLFGDRMVVANATGCSSIYGGNLPTTPWTTDGAGRGPAWSNSLFEDNAEFGYGMRLTIDQLADEARLLLGRLRAVVGEGLVTALLDAVQNDEQGISEQRERVAALKKMLEWSLKRRPRGETADAERRLLSIADYLVKKSVWIIGGDGWAYDIGYGGLDHVLASGRNVNVLVLDTEVYSNTGGQMSKATPRGAVAKFAAGGKAAPKKDLGLIAMTYGGIYVARVAMGANDGQTLRAFREAEAYDGPSLIIAYSHCIAHGYDLRHGMDQQKAAVLSGHW
ncbi:MAG TPA: pyruvate:ferredoxin (flavodoxin) oxidoreductase, partial [Vicinamibacterales bacterium]|nr:pyruvate:ferredoxin (flavodoxin) oxidoreductase [Vicinamibacterales bacterium]